MSRADLPADTRLWPDEAREELLYRSGLLLSDAGRPPYTDAQVAAADRRAAPKVRRWWAQRGAR